ncbi:hypothetical protein ARMGADRAFT_1031157 [Armillaria gallica]|uniref:Uncharacterized protein n=1 Tax=Armillaria gallica TaxID=47427 RepID=A0A2H3DDS5_ARMGA|nr:hypothetical protein ARMGADRAFT_1031157 [Armillaria gallica]
MWDSPSLEEKERQLEASRRYEERNKEKRRLAAKERMQRKQMNNKKLPQSEQDSIRDRQRKSEEAYHRRNRADIRERTASRRSDIYFDRWKDDLDNMPHPKHRIGCLQRLEDYKPAELAAWKCAQEALKNEWKPSRSRPIL